MNVKNSLCDRNPDSRGSDSDTTYEYDTTWEDFSGGKSFGKHQVLARTPMIKDEILAVICAL